MNPARPESQADAIKREMFTHLSDLRDSCDALLEARDPVRVYNDLQHLRSLAGQLDAAVRRFRFLA